MRISLLLLSLVGLQACVLYDADLMGPIAGTGEAGSGGGGAAGDGADAGPDAGPDGGENRCIYVGASDCEWRCPETCNGEDDDCDGVADNGPDEELCNLLNAFGVCVEGGCRVATCDEGYVSCDGDDATGCETTLNDVMHCGLCNNQCSIANTMVACEQATCTAHGCLPGFGDCNDNLLGDGCEIRLNTLQNCGDCGVTCGPVGNASVTCASGSCAVETCYVGFGDCDGVVENGCEEPLNTLEHCGECGEPCALPNATGSCASGSCVPAECASGFADCDGQPANGCEQSLNAPDHCGACGAVCNLPNVAAHSCVDGVCSVGTCDAGWGNCDSNHANGCERRLDTLSHCGACDVDCTEQVQNAEGICDGDACEFIACDLGFGDCNEDPSDGCEAPLGLCDVCESDGACDVGEFCSGIQCTTRDCATLEPGFADCDLDGLTCEVPVWHVDPQESFGSCGACGRSCGPLPNAMVGCADGICRIAACSEGFADCDGILANGCETSIYSNDNCGSCGSEPCSIANGNASCATGTCEFVGCNSGYADCDGQPGCETLINTKTNCGACGSVCEYANASEACVSGTCTLLSCDAGYANCNGSLDNGGCETNTRTLANCGGCGVACSLANASQSCETGSCVLGACITGWGNCDGSSATGCETSLTTLNNCGSCGAGCSFANASASCATGQCVMGACNAGWANCDGNSANGCETQLGTSSNCNRCGNSCNIAAPRCCADRQCRWWC